MPTFAVPIIRHFISGEAYFSGIGMLMLTVLWWYFHGWGGKRMLWILGSIGALLVILSATPANNLSDSAIWLILAGWGVYQLVRREASPNLLAMPNSPEDVRIIRRGDCFGVLVLLFIQAANQLEQHQSPEIRVTKDAPIVIIGDSVSAGVGENEATTWPNLLRDRTHREVIDLSRMGATVGSALTHLPDQFPTGSLAIIELGGNDVLGTTSMAEFRIQLEQLLQRVTSMAGQTVMFELPLPPFSQRLGAVQRELARKYNAKLIPKRVLANVLISPKTTLDSIHLNQAGHDQIAAFVEKLLNTK